MKQLRIIKISIVFCITVISFIMTGNDSLAFSVEYRPCGLYTDLVPQKLADFTGNALKKEVSREFKIYNKYKDLKKTDKMAFYKKAGKAEKIVNKFKGFSEDDVVEITYPFINYDPVMEDVDIPYQFVVADGGKPFAILIVFFDPSWRGKKIGASLWFDEDTYIKRLDITEDDIFYTIDKKMYKENKNKKEIIRDTKLDGVVDLSATPDPDIRTILNKLDNMGYEEKKEMIIGHYKKIMSGKKVRKSFEKFDPDSVNEDGSYDAAAAVSKQKRSLMTVFLKSAAAAAVIIILIILIIKLKRSSLKTDQNDDGQ